MMASLALTTLLGLTLLLAYGRAPRRLSGASFLLFLVCGYALAKLSLVAVASALVLGAAVYAFAQGTGPRWGRWLSGSLMVVITVAHGLHLVPGFQNWLLFAGLRFSERAAPASLYINFDKPLFALLYLIFCGKLISLRASPQVIAYALTRSLIPLVLLVIPTALLAGYVAFDPKLPSAQGLLWAGVNLFLVCLAEEAFFRAFLQRQLALWWHGWRYGEQASLVVAALLFGLAHSAGGPVLVVLGCVAGFFYGRAWQLSGSLEAPILCHFGLNFVHFAFFTYPFLA